MLAFLIFAVILFVFVFVLVVYFHPRSSASTIPGPEISNAKDGNVVDIKEAGGLHYYLKNLHSSYGDIVSFWIGEQMIISTSDIEYFKEYNNTFDKSDIFFRFLAPVIGSKNILFTNGIQGRLAHKMLQYYCDTEVLASVVSNFNLMCDSLLSHLKKKPSGFHFPVNEYMTSLAIKAIGFLLFGKGLEDKDLLKLSETYEVCMKEVVSRHYDLPLESSDPREKRFKEEIDSFLGIISKLASNCSSQETNACRGDGFNAFKPLCSLLCQEANKPECISHELATYMVVGVNPLANLLTSCIYYVVNEDQVQNLVFEEVKTFGSSQDYLKNENYVHKVILETLRLSPPVPYTNRKRDVDTILGKHLVPKNTPVIQALAVSFEDENYFKCPKIFNPQRFEDIDNVFGGSELSFCPFGFAGKRKCPFEKFSIIFTKIVLASLFRHFIIELIPDQKREPRFRWVNSQESELWVTLKQR